MRGSSSYRAPALLWGVTYLHFGLVPTILAHFTYNLSLISLPLFASAAPGVVLDRAAVVAAGLVPLLVVLRARRKVGARAVAPEWAYNRAWRPPAQPVEAAAPALSEPPPRAGLQAGMRRFPGRRKLVYAVGAAGAVAWVAGALVTGW